MNPQTRKATKQRRRGTPGGSHVLILHNELVLPPDHPESESESEILYTVEHVEESLRSAGYRVSRLGLGPKPEGMVSAISAAEADVVFNLFEGFPDHGQTEATVTGILEWLGLEFTGSPSRALSLARDKPLAKLVLRGAGLPTPDFLTFDRQELPRLPDELISGHTGRALRWPVIVKLADQDASVGIDQGSVVTDMPALRHRMQELTDRFDAPLLVEEYIDGRELTVGVIAMPTPSPLPVSEFEFLPEPGRWPIVTYDAKWSLQSSDYEHTPYRELAEVPEALTRTLGDLAVRAFNVFGLRDYGRIDFRVTAAGEPYILEANPNPDLSPTAGLAGVLDAVGMSYDNFLQCLVKQAFSRIAE